MARSNPKALVIGVQPSQMEDTLVFREALKAFIDKGHIVIFDPKEFLICDVIIGPRCWRIDSKLKLGDDSTEEESLERQLEVMEKGVRAIKYPKEKKDAETEKNSTD